MQHVICTGNLGSKEQYDELRELAPNVHVAAGDFECTVGKEGSGGGAEDAANQGIGVANMTGGATNMTSPLTTTITTPAPTATTPLPVMPTFPETKVVQVGHFRIGVIHGHQVVPWGDHMSLAMVRRKLDVDILISGHTHVNEVVEHEGCYHINPGSITGAYSSFTDKDITPSFVLLAVQGSKVVCYVYELIDGEVDVSKTEFTKNFNAGHAGTEVGVRM